jgi:hypothetical protein
VNHGVILQVLMFVELRNLLEGQSISGAWLSKVILTLRGHQGKELLTHLTSAVRQ